MKQQTRKSLNVTALERTNSWDTLEAAWFFFLLFIAAVIRECSKKVSLLFGGKSEETDRTAYVPLYRNFDKLFKNYFFARMLEIANMPITTMAAPMTTIRERVTTDKLGELKETGKQIQLINMTSYNYLDMNQNEGDRADRVEEEIHTRGLTTCSSRCEMGTQDSHRLLESLIAQFLHVEDVFTVGMGFATNATVIPCLANGDSLILSDEKNHSSLVLGCRLSGATIRVYKHNDMDDLEDNIRDAILNGNRKTHRPFKKILIIAEGIYSMEGTIVELRDIIRLKKKYRCYLFIDEAHSIGALGRTGRGVCDLQGCDPHDIDILMGTFTKSFSANGGYVAGKKEVIDYIKSQAASSIYAAAMPPAVARQVIAALNILMNTEEGAAKFVRLSENVHYFRTRLMKLGFPVIGHEASPVVPVMITNPSIGLYTVRALREKKVGCIYVGFPGTELMGGRLRFCLSAGHTRQMLDYVIDALIAVDKKVTLVKKQL